MATNSPPPMLPPPPAFAKGCSGQTSAGQKVASSSENCVDLFSNDADTDDSPTGQVPTTRSPNLPRKSPLQRTTRGREPPPTRILDFLFLGNVQDARNVEFLRSSNIRTILNVSTEEYWSVDKNVEIHPFVALDTANFKIGDYFQRAHELINGVRKAYYKHLHNVEHSTTPQQLGPPPCVLVHCQKGKSRSATIVLSYLIRYNGWTVAEALNYVVRRRSIVEPNIGFIDTLREYQESLDATERTLARTSLCLSLRGVDDHLHAQHIEQFFETNVGLVMEVNVHNRSSTSTTSSAQGTSESDTTASGSRPPPVPQPQKPLVLVFFACAESCGVSRRLFKRRPDLLLELGQDVRLNVAKFAESFRRMQHSSSRQVSVDDFPMDE